MNCLNKILPVYKVVCKTEMVTLKGYEIEITVYPGCKPSFSDTRSVPYALNERIQIELERLVKDDIYEPIQYSKWTSPIVPVLKDIGTMRICGGYKQLTRHLDVTNTLSQKLKTH